MKRAWIAILGVCWVGACASHEAAPANDSAKKSALAAQGTQQGTGDPRCDATLKGREFSEYDTSGDEQFDVRKVFARLGDLATSRLVMICREADVNRDGKKDVVRTYDDEGNPIRELADRNFDGKWDLTTLFQSGEIVLQELDDNFDARTDTKIYYERGKPVRAERDLHGRSSPNQWRPDRWEYFEAGKMVRMGTDLDGDNRVDHWDRDEAWKRAQDAAKAQVTSSEAAGEGG